MSDGMDRREGLEDRRQVNVALLEHRLTELGRDVHQGFVRLEAKIDGNLETLSGRIEREAVRQQEQLDLQSQRAIDRAETLASADSLLAERVEGRLASLEADTLERVSALERWRVEVEARVKALAESRDSGLKVKHLWLAVGGLLIAFGALLVTAVGVVLTVMLSA